MKTYFIRFIMLLAALISWPVFAAIPNAPTELMAVPVYTANDMRLFWTDNAGDESGFKIERKTTVTSFTQIAIVGPNIIEFTDDTTAVDTEYTYRVRAYNADGDSSFSNEGANKLSIVWPLQNGNHEMMNSWQDATIFNIWRFHEGIDIQADGNGGQVVLATRGGIIKKKDAGFSGGFFSVEVLDGTGTVYDIYLHIQNITLKAEGEVVMPGEVVAEISTTAYGAGRRHVHQLAYTSWTGTYGYEADGSNIYNPFEFFQSNADRDPLGNTPGLEDVDGEGNTIIYKRPDNSYFTTGAIWGDVDISAEVTDNMGSDPRQGVHKSGYWVESTVAAGDDIRNAAAPYILHNFDNWFGQSGSQANFLAVYDPDKTIGSKRFHHLLTNTTGTDGAVANLDANQVWRTDARAASGTAPNGSDATRARENQEAKFPDGTYNIHVLLEDQLHNSDSVQAVVLDNSRPYVQRVTVYSNSDTVYQSQWNWDNSIPQLVSQPANFADAVMGIASRNNDVTIEVEFSEAMQSASITAITPLGVTPALTSSQPAHARTIWQGIIAEADIASDGSDDGIHMVTINGSDLAGNALLLVSDRASMGVDHHNRDAAGILRGATGTDAIHGFEIGPVFCGGSWWCCLLIIIVIIALIVAVIALIRILMGAGTPQIQKIFAIAILIIFLLGLYILFYCDF